MTIGPFFAVAAVLLLGACGPLVQIGGNAPSPDALYTLTATAPASSPAGQLPVDVRAAVSIEVPSVPGALQTLRIPVAVADTQMQYLKAAQWSEQPNRLFQRLLADTLVNGGIAVIDQRSSGTTAARRLTGQLLAFGVDVRGASPMVRVRYDATLSGPNGLRQRRFEREAAVALVDGDAVATALNGAANAVAADVAAWVGGPGGRVDPLPPRS